MKLHARINDLANLSQLKLTQLTQLKLIHLSSIIHKLNLNVRAEVRLFFC
jgi:hypothetical protein